MSKPEEIAHRILSLLGEFHSDWNVQQIVKILEEKGNE